MSSADRTVRSCPMCGKPLHGSSACSTAPGWPPSAPSPDRRRLEIAADLVLEQRHGKALTEHERRFVREGFLEQVAARWRAGAEG